MENHAPQQAELQALIEEAKTLAQALHAPGNSSAATTIQERLHSIQKSGAGWVIADGLLGSDDPNVRFFGALTLTMKIHQDWENLGVEKARNLLIRLVDCFVLLVNRGETAIVMRKFLTCLTAFFFKPNAPWTFCVRQIAISVANGKYVPEEQADQPTFEKLALPSLAFERVMAILSFSTTLAEESLRYSMIGNGPADRLEVNIEDVLLLVNFAFQRAASSSNVGSAELSEQSSRTLEEAIKSLHAWLHALRAATICPKDLPTMVAPVMDYAVQFLMEPSLAQTSMDLLTETLGNQPKLLTVRHLNGILDFLISPHAEQYAMALLNGGDEFEMMRFLELLTQYANVEQVEILTQEPHEKHGKILFLLYKLFHGEGYPGVEDVMITTLLEYWTEAADNVNELIMEGGLEETNEVMKRNFMQVIIECHDRLRYPGPETLKEWDDDDLTYFNTFRRDFTDYLLASYPLLGVGVIERFQESAVAALNAENWDSFEVSMFCLASLSEGVFYNEHADNILRTLFHSPIFIEIWMNQRNIPLKTRQTLSEVVARYTQYFNRDHVLLPPVLSFLFNSLGVSACTQAASKAISKLCRDCRKSLPAYVDEFVGRFDQLRSNITIPAHALERVAEGVAAVIQAVPSDATKASLLTRILNPLYEQAVMARQEKHNGQYDIGLSIALMVARCTASIGKGLRSPEENVIDLDNEGPVSQSKNFWTSDQAGVQVQTCVMGILDAVVSEFPNDGEIIETACDVLKAGFTEQSPGPYVLPPNVTVRFVKAVSANSPRFSTLMGTASAFLAAHSSRPAEVHAEVVDLTMHIYQLICYMGRYPEHYDPEVAHSCIDFITRLLPRYMDSFASLSAPQPDGPPPIRAILTFTLKTLKGPDPLPLRAACAFWVTLLHQSDLPDDFIPGLETATRTPSFIDEYLRALAEVVVFQIAGGCARSDLDHLSDIIKKFVHKHQGAARLYLGHALHSLSVSQQQQQQQQQSQADRGTDTVSVGDRARFLATILALRGARGTNKVVRDFWVLCRGQGYAYPTWNGIRGI